VTRYNFPALPPLTATTTTTTDYMAITSIIYPIGALEAASEPQRRL
jgi:hypothetical protein